MKRFFFATAIIVFVSMLFMSCGPQNNRTDLPGGDVSGYDSVGATTDKNAIPVISFEKDFHDFGKLSSGELVTYAFKFKNTGNSVLVISNVSTSCGCAVTDFPKQPVKPGEESTIDVKFDSAGKHGRQSKSITVYANTEPSVTTLRIQAVINESEEN